MSKSIGIKPAVSMPNHIAGWLIYPSGDLVAQLIMGQVSLARTLIVVLAGGLLYRFEIPACFRRIDAVSFLPSTILRHPWLGFFTKAVNEDRKLNWLGRTAAAMLYFNPLWITRHLLIISATSINFSVGVTAVLGGVLSSGAISFVTNLPLTVAANYFIQVHVPARWRFFASATLTAALTLKYAIEFRFFGGA